LKIIHRFSQQESTPYQANQIYSHYNGRFVFTPSYFPFYQPQSDVHSPNLAVPGIEGGPNSTQTVASSKRPRQRRDWTDTETSLLWELYETAYSLGKLTSKTTKANSGGWENLEKDFNRELASRNMAPRTLQQMKEKINEFIWNQIKHFMSPLPISSIHGFWGGGVDCGFKGLEALECEL